MAGLVSKVLSIIPPRLRGTGTSRSFTNTYNPSATGSPLATPAYRDHLNDILTNRIALDSRALLKEMFRTDPDMSAAVNSYLTVADTEMQILVYDDRGAIDRKGHQLLQTSLLALETRYDYSKGFEFRQTLQSYCKDCRYMLLLRGGIGTELVLDKLLMPTELRNVDLQTIEWYEKQPGKFTPVQRPPGASEPIDLNIPTFFTSWFRKDPTDIYSFSPFISAINTIAARTQIVNDLYRIMTVTGFPRIHMSVVEEVIAKSAPPEARTDPKKMKEYKDARLAEVQTVLTNLRADESLVTTDAVESKILNDKNPGAALDIQPMIDVLNAQNQAGLKVMATVIGRGESGVNTASVESLIFTKNADALNEPIAELLTHLFTMVLRMQGYTGRVVVSFAKAELRPELELEPQLVMKQSRFLQLLSEGIIDDDTFHLEVLGRIRPDNIPELSGTKFLTPAPAVDTGKISPNSDPQGKSLSPKGSASARSNGPANPTKKGPPK